MDETKEIELQKKIAKWDAEKSVKKLIPKIERWKKLTVEIARELFIAHEYLTTQKGQRTDPEAEDYISYTWSDYCSEIGLSRQTAHNWLKRFIPAERSEDQQDILLSPEAMRQAAEEKKLEDLESREARLAYYKKYNDYPEGWTNADRLEYQRREDQERAKKLADMWMGNIPATKPKRDYFQDILNATRGRKKRFALPPGQEVIQAQTFNTLDQYICLFPDYKTKIMAAINLQEKLKRMVNIYAEEELSNAGEDDE